MCSSLFANLSRNTVVGKIRIRMKFQNMVIVWAALSAENMKEHT